MRRRQMDRAWKIPEIKIIHIMELYVRILSIVLHWAPLTTSNLIHKNMLVKNSTRYIRTF